MGLPVTYVWTHDSIGLGEDGPTHQPIEHLAALRAIPGLDVVRPADANETAAAWHAVLERTDRPAGIALTRQNVPVFPRGEDGFATRPTCTAAATSWSTPAIEDRDGEPDVILMGTGSEVQVAVAARELLAADGIRARVVSFPCLEWFEEQEESYRETVLPPTVKARVSVEAGVTQGWREFVGDHGRIVSIDHYGASADFARIYEEFDITARGGGRRRPRQPAHPDRLTLHRRPDRLRRRAAPPNIRRNHMNDRLKRSADAGVSIWLDDLSRERLETGNLADLVKNEPRRGRHDQPGDLRRGAGRRRALRRRRCASSPPRAPTSTRHVVRAHHRRRAQGLRRDAAGLRRHRRRRRPRLDRGRAPASPTTPARPSRRPPSSGGPSTSPTSSSRSPAPRRAGRPSRRPSPRASRST